MIVEVFNVRCKIVLLCLPHSKGRQVTEIVEMMGSSAKVVKRETPQRKKELT